MPDGAGPVGAGPASGEAASGEAASGEAASAPPARGRERRERKAMLLRLDPDLHDALARWAADELRSTNAHVEYLLRHAASRAGRLRD